MAAQRAPAAPADLVELGAVRGSYGVRGWVRIAPYAADGAVLDAVPTWWLLHANERKAITVEARRRQGKDILAKWPGCESKEAADSLRGAVIAVARSEFPRLAEGEHYLADLIGSQVVNREGHCLGSVAGLRANEVAGSPRQWLEVIDDQVVRLIPMIERYVDAVDPERRLVRVDWQRDW